MRSSARWLSRWSGGLVRRRAPGRCGAGVGGRISHTPPSPATIGWSTKLRFELHHPRAPHEDGGQDATRVRVDPHGGVAERPRRRLGFIRRSPEQDPADRADREHPHGQTHDQRRPLRSGREDVPPPLGRFLILERWRHLRTVDARDAGEAELPVQALQPVDAVLGERDARRRTRSPGPTPGRAPRRVRRPTSRAPPCSPRVRRACHRPTRARRSSRRLGSRSRARVRPRWPRRRNGSRRPGART